MSACCTICRQTYSDSLIPNETVRFQKNTFFTFIPTPISSLIRFRGTHYSRKYHFQYLCFLSRFICYHCRKYQNAKYPGAGPAYFPASSAKLAESLRAGSGFQKTLRLFSAGSFVPAENHTRGSGLSLRPLMIIDILAAQAFWTSWTRS